MHLNSRIVCLVLSSVVVTVALAQDRGIGAAVSTGAASSDQRVALVIGNSKYENAPLANPVNDATDMAAVLKKCGFSVTVKTDCTLRSMKETFDEFGSGVPKGGVALFFYAGHGIQSDGRNYLIPIDANPKGPGDLEYECIDTGRIFAKLEDGQAKLNIIILDACRNNPFSRSWSRAVPSGLATMDAPRGSILIYATEAGSVAQDGTERNGLFTGSLINNITKPGTDAVAAFKKAAEEVRLASKGQQQPLMSFTFTGDFTFIQANTVNVTTPASDTPVMTLPPAPTESLGGLQVRVNVANATVKVNGETQEPASPGKPANIQLPPGKVTVEVSADGYEPESKEFDVKEADWTKATFKLAKVMVVKPDKPKRPPTVTMGSEPKAGDVRVFEGGEFAWIPAGEFEMGDRLSASRIASTYGGEEKWYQDAPKHTVTISEGFWLGTHEVTNREFEAFVKETSHKTDAEREGWGYGRTKVGDTYKFDKVNGLTWREPGWETKASHPVVLVSWTDAQAYIAWVNGRGDGTYRLPTEAQWEYACRAGTTTEYFWGDRSEGGKGYLNGADQTKSPQGTSWTTKFEFSDGYYFVAPVGSFTANPWGLFDMHGNVNEWCQDWYGDYPSGAVTDSQGAASGTYRVVRGGSWYNLPGYCRAAPRYPAAPDDRHTAIGFRLLRTQN